MALDLLGAAAQALSVQRDFGGTRCARSQKHAHLVLCGRLDVSSLDGRGAAHDDREGSDELSRVEKLEGRARKARERSNSTLDPLPLPHASDVSDDVFVATRAALVTRALQA